jgi:hypothetical protein
VRFKERGAFDKGYSLLEMMTFPPMKRTELTASAWPRNTRESCDADTRMSHSRSVESRDDVTTSGAVVGCADTFVTSLS